MKNFLNFIRENKKYENINENNNDEKIVYFHIDPQFTRILFELEDEYVIAKYLLYLTKGVERKNLNKDLVDYIKIETSGSNIGYISYLKERNFDEIDKWNSIRRIKQKVTQFLKYIYTPEFIAPITQRDYEQFINKINSKFSNLKVYEWRGDEVLRAYNYKKELVTNFGRSCANFHQNEFNFGDYTEPNVSDFDIYTKNPDNCGIVVVMDGDKILARRSFQQGLNLINCGVFKKDLMHTVYGNYYGIGGEGSTYDAMIINYLKNNYERVYKMNTDDGGFAIKMETRWKYYCPFDSMLVSFKYQLLFDQRERTTYELNKIYNNLDRNNSYHASCPLNLVNERIKEENEKKNAIISQ